MPRPGCLQNVHITKTKFRSLRVLAIPCAVQRLCLDMTDSPQRALPDERYSETKNGSNITRIPEDARHHSEHHVAADRLARKLSARQVQMIAIGGTIGTGLFLGTFMFPSVIINSHTDSLRYWEVFIDWRTGLHAHLVFDSRHYRLLHDASTWRDGSLHANCRCTNLSKVARSTTLS